MFRIILIVDDDAVSLQALAQALQSDDCGILSASSVAMALEQLATYDVAVIIARQHMEHMGEMSGAEFLRSAQSSYPDAVRIMLGEHADTKSIAAARKRGEIYDFIALPWDQPCLRATLQQAFAYRDQKFSPASTIA